MLNFCFMPRQNFFSLCHRSCFSPFDHINSHYGDEPGKVCRLPIRHDAPLSQHRRFSVLIGVVSGLSFSWPLLLLFDRPPTNAPRLFALIALFLRAPTLSGRHLHFFPRTPFYMKVYSVISAPFPGNSHPLVVGVWDCVFGCGVVCPLVGVDVSHPS